MVAYGREVMILGMGLDTVGKFRQVGSDPVHAVSGKIHPLYSQFCLSSMTARVRLNYCMDSPGSPPMRLASHGCWLCIASIIRVHYK
jgi:hypothetical protein